MKTSSVAALVGMSVMGACASFTQAHREMTNRPADVAGEWIDVRHATPDDTSLWILRADGYDGTAHLVRKTTASGVVTERQQSRYATWYLRGNVADSARQICFARRLGRDGLTCWRFLLDTIVTPDGERRRMIVKDYQGQHTRADRILLSRDPR
jgi:hypothetical protein